MACNDPTCLSSMSLILTPPDFPPPPPLPSFILEIVQKDNLTESCDLCSKWGDKGLQVVAETNFTFILLLVAIISALSGAGVMAAILSVKRIRKGRSRPDSMRHLERKCNDHQTLPLPPRSSNSTPLSNTYCEGPYNDNGKEYPSSSNIYAELHSAPNNSVCGGSGMQAEIWRRPPIPPPALDNCYLELRDLPGLPSGLVTTSTPLFTQLERGSSGSGPQSPSNYSLTPSTATTASYYTDLDMRGCRDKRI